MVHQSNQTHFLLVTYSAQGHINPALQFAKRLIRTAGARVTFVTTVSAHRRMSNNSTSCPEGLTVYPFSDGYDDGFKLSRDDINQYVSNLRRNCTEALSGLVEKSVDQSQPISCLIYTLMLPWAAEVASKFQLPSALLWIQPATVFDIYYYHFSGHPDLRVDDVNDPEYEVKLPGLPLLKGKDLPSLVLPSNIYSLLLDLFREQFEILLGEIKSFWILVNTFDELELEALGAIERYNLIGIGPLVPSAFLDGKDPSDKSFGGDLLSHSKDYIEWLDTKDKSSVVYVSFGSLAVLSNKQMEALAWGLVDSGRPFLWVIRAQEAKEEIQEEKENEAYSEILREEHKGMIVPWCSQVEVLSHESIGCFVTHCGWNSTLETLAMGVPVVAFPQWTDQGTNAKLIEDVWKIGVRVRPNEEKIVESNEIIRCLDEVMEKEESRENAKKWKNLAREAVKEGGSSDRNLRKFVEELRENAKKWKNLAREAVKEGGSSDRNLRKFVEEIGALGNLLENEVTD